MYRQANRLLHHHMNDFHPELVAVWQDLRNISNFDTFRRCCPSAITSEDSRYFKILQLSVEKSLICFLYGVNSSTSVIEKCCVLASLLVMNTALYPLPPSSEIVLGPMRRLKILLEELNLDPLSLVWNSFADVLLWMSFVGRYCCENHIHRSWFVVQVATGLQILRLSTRQEMRELMLEFFYSEEAFDRPIHRIFDEASLLFGTPQQT